MPIPIADKTPQDTDVAICFIWIEMKDDHVSWEHLVHAFENFSNKQYESMIIPANIAVESRTTRILKNILMKTAGKDNVEDCLKQSYGHNLNVIFPAILKPRSINFINDTIRGKLNRLKDLRNNLVHDGKLSKEIKDEEAEEIICAAIFGFYYMKYIENLFNE